MAVTDAAVTGAYAPADDRARRKGDPMSAKASTLQLEVRPRARTWYFSVMFVVIIAAAAIALMLRPTSSAGGGASAGSRVTHTVQVGGGGQFQYKPLP